MKNNHVESVYWYSKTCVKQPPSKRPKIGYQYQLSLNAGQKYCRMLQGEHSAILLTFIKHSAILLTFIKHSAILLTFIKHSAILLTFIKLPFVIFVLSIFEWPFYTEFTVVHFDSPT